MAAFVQRITESFGWRRASAESPSTPETRISSKISAHMIGKYCADYSELSAQQLAESVPEMDELIQHSRVVSEKRGL